MRANCGMALLVCIVVVLAGCGTKGSAEHDEEAEKVFAQGKEIYLHDLTWTRQDANFSGTVKYKINWPKEEVGLIRGSFMFQGCDRSTGRLLGGSVFIDNSAGRDLPYNRKDGSKGEMSWSCPVPRPERPGVNIVMTVSALYISIPTQLDAKFHSNAVSFATDQASGPAAP